MKVLLIGYPKCSTCKNASKFLEEKKIEYEYRNIVEECPKKEELKIWIKQSGYPIRKFFNTSGNVYKSLNLKEKMEHLSDEEKLDLLSSNGMLIKRPILINGDQVLVGFKKEEWEKI
ncbi:MAG TPA: arsenate reductase family protein [Candidatus Merdicola faecigallinarum]|uniref:Arsenate reductase family protein n=1 Tax=Candidatus Merdicola faecigallinarum TaxID=2840862 RepID=A0A9D1S971_9FIRM|nr:arsenate reductase family protein [Candidatus Merdicola faecigallinarum]